MSTDNCTCQENGEHCCMVHSTEPEIPVVNSSTQSDNTSEGLGQSQSVSTTFSDAQLLDVLSNERITWEYLAKNETDPELKASVEEIIALINKFDARKREEMQAELLRKELRSSDNPGTTET